ncbi:MAG: dihydrodipicolinate synthase family protein [Bryobacteraceae bacterium]
MRRKSKEIRAGLPRRAFVGWLGASALHLAMAGEGRGSKPLRGIFPIAQTPFTDADRLDLDALAREVKFIDKAGAHGLAWPQMASEYSTLSETERLAGAEAIVSAGKSLRPAIVIGVQSTDLASTLRYARHAQKHGADAIICIPPVGQSNPEAMIEWYRELGKATALPLIVQSTGDMSVELIARMSREIPTLRYVKDEAGRSPLARIAQLREKSGERLNVFTGNHGSTLIDEMQRGSSGSMPAAPFVDLYAQAWDLWLKGSHNEAMEIFAKALLFIPEAQAYGIQGLKYLLHLRGVFPAYGVRVKDALAPLDESGKRTLSGMLAFVKPWLRA